MAEAINNALEKLHWTVVDAADEADYTLRYAVNRIVATSINHKGQYPEVESIVTVRVGFTLTSEDKGDYSFEIKVKEYERDSGVLYRDQYEFEEKRRVMKAANRAAWSLKDRIVKKLNNPRFRK